VPRFRPDLAARLGGLTIELPPLGERREDLGLIVATLLGRLGAEHAAFSAEAVRALFRYRWPHNVRELEKVLEAAVALSGGAEIRAEHLASNIPVEPTMESGDSDPILADLHALLGEHRGNLSAVARAMGKGRMQIQRWVKRYKLELESYRK
jgi:DNA-binding NtrC family response regulator